jgi:hypothetical protein
MQENELKEEVVKKLYPLNITCDVCGKQFFYNKEEDFFEIQEFFSIHHSCGYGSKFGDGVALDIDICQHCMKELLGNYFRITEYY